MQQFAAVKSFSTAIAFHNRDRHRFDPFIGSETKFTVQTFAASPHTATRIGGTRFKNAAVGVLARGALHGPKIRGSVKQV
jgi:hypothetical protein